MKGKHIVIFLINSLCSFQLEYEEHRWGFSAVILQNQYGDIPPPLSFHSSDLHVSPRG